METTRAGFAFSDIPVAHPNFSWLGILDKAIYIQISTS
jgi:hypothetical protein